jgi:hypothetical protein
MIPKNEVYRVREAEVFYDNGYLVRKFIVLVPDRTISGDYRHEVVYTKIPTFVSEEDA